MLGAEPVGSTSTDGTFINISRYIANGHTIFNVINAGFFLLTLKWLVKAAILISPSDKEEENFYRLPNFSDRLIDVPIALIAKVKSEILRMAQAAKQTFLKTTTQVRKKNYKELSRWKRVETHLDDMQREIMSCLVRLYQNDLSETESREISNLMRMTNNIERIGDSVENIAHAVETLIDEKMELSVAALSDLNDLSTDVLTFIDLIIQGIQLGNSTGFIEQANALENTIDNKREELRQKHIHRIRLKACGFDQGLIYINILTNLEKIGDYCFNIAHAITDKR